MTPPPDQLMGTRVLVEGLNCGGCVGTLTRRVGGIDGVLGVEVDLHPGQTSAVVITHGPSIEPQALPGTVAGLGYRVVPGGPAAGA
ncbi:MAG: heavy-metal-associated domain-containing protein [Actinobacteria bacterium]|nr:heavy-metal-associated domain-containing protein [Actinomycetota bacterium]